MASRKKWMAHMLKLGIPLILTVTMLISTYLIAYAETDPGGTVSWRVVYTDKETHAKKLCDTESGTCQAGDSIYIGIPQTVTDEDGNIWETNESSGMREIKGPGTEIIYIEYEKTGELPKPEDPYAEAEAELEEWIGKAKQAEAVLTGKSASLIPTSCVICETEGKARLRLLSAGSYISDTASHEVYVISKNSEPTGIVLKEVFGTGIVYSNDLLAETQIGDDLYSVHRFVIRKNYGAASCHHSYMVTADREATCTQRGITKYKCVHCGNETIVYHAATGHTDGDTDGICDTCGQDTSSTRPASWKIGDLVTEYVGDTEYVFRCIDEDYADSMGNRTGYALFLCDTVIPGSTGSEYREESDGTGHLVNVWHPGPIAYFGENNNYKYSKIKAFLDGTNVHTAAKTVVGVSNSYTGNTTAELFSQMTDAGLKSYAAGYQQMNAELFILSVDEALRYKEYLWKFGDTDTDNPETVTGATANAYWLRNPGGTADDYSTSGLGYVVDLITGNIHPEMVKPKGGTGDPFIDTQTSVGIRPAFTLRNSK